MKTKIYFLSIVLSVISLVACNANEGVEDISSTSGEESSSVLMEVPGFTTLPENLTQSDVDGLMQMREEEKLAQDVYLYFYAKYKYRIFTNIAASEKAHTSAVLALINYFKLSDPAKTSQGEFTNPDIASLYKTLIEKGTTVENALATGAFIEEYDINDLKEEIALSQNADVKKVYGNLLRASGFHLKSFAAMLKFKGIVYQPQILTAEEYAAIVK